MSEFAPGEALAVAIAAVAIVVFITAAVGAGLLIGQGHWITGGAVAVVLGLVACKVWGDID